MRRWLALLRFEFQLFRSSVLIHLIGMLQPTVLYLIMSAVLVTPLFEMAIKEPDTPAGRDLVRAMEQVGSPVGSNYIDPVFVQEASPDGHRQVVWVEETDGQPVTVQRFNRIDSNMVKNLRNRLTSAALYLWQEDLGDAAVRIEEHPWLPNDISYHVYFGMGIITMSVFAAASMIGSITTATDFERDTIMEYRTSPAGSWLLIGSRLLRLLIVAVIGGSITVLVVGWLTGFWPDSYLQVVAIIIPLGITAGCVGVLAGMLLKKMIPAFIVALVFTFITWLMGGAFGLPEGFSPAYAAVSRWMPNSYTVRLLFSQYFPAQIGNPGVSMLYSVLIALAMLLLTSIVYRRTVTQPE